MSNKYSAGVAVHVRKPALP